MRVTDGRKVKFYATGWFVFSLSWRHPSCDRSCNESLLCKKLSVKFRSLLTEVNSMQLCESLCTRCVCVCGCEFCESEFKSVFIFTENKKETPLACLSNHTVLHLICVRHFVQFGLNVLPSCRCGVSCFFVQPCLSVVEVQMIKNKRQLKVNGRTKSYRPVSLPTWTQTKTYCPTKCPRSKKNHSKCAVTIGWQRSSSASVLA